MKQTTFSTIIIFSLSFYACSQSNNKNNKGAYIVDSTVKGKIEQKVKSFNHVTMGSMDFKMFENDSLIADSYTKGKSIECMIMSELDGDTANITGYLGFTAGFGFQIALFRDTCIVRHFAKTDARIYKVHKSDSLNFGVSVPCKSYTLTLVNKPTFKKGEIIEGIVSLISEDYYEVENDKHESRFRMELTGYFKTEPLQSLDDQIKELNKTEK